MIFRDASRLVDHAGGSLRFVLPGKIREEALRLMTIHGVGAGRLHGRRVDKAGRMRAGRRTGKGVSVRLSGEIVSDNGSIC